MGEVGGTCEIIVILCGSIYLFFLAIVKYNTDKEVTKTFNITEKDKKSHKNLTGEEFDSKEAKERRSENFEKFQTGEQVLRTIALVNLIS